MPKTKAKTLKTLTEREIEQHCLDWLNIQDGVWAEKIDTKGTFNSSIGSHMKLPKHVSKGRADCLVMLNGGRFFWVEFKDAKNVQSLEQKAFQYKCSCRVIGYYVCRSKSEVESVLHAERQKANGK